MEIRAATSRSSLSNRRVQSRHANLKAPLPMAKKGMVFRAKKVMTYSKLELKVIVASRLLLLQAMERPTMIVELEEEANQNLTLKCKPQERKIN
jgi:hypothetical protein